MRLPLLHTFQCTGQAMSFKSVPTGAYIPSLDIYLIGTYMFFVNNKILHSFQEPIWTKIPGGWGQRPHDTYDTFFTTLRGGVGKEKEVSLCHKVIEKSLFIEVLRYDIPMTRPLYVSYSNEKEKLSSVQFLLILFMKKLFICCKSVVNLEIMLCKTL